MNIEAKLTLAFEGGVCAGKTTVLRRLEHAAVLTRVPEYTEVIDPLLQPTLFALQPLTRTMLYLSAELPRLRLAKESAVHGLDRSFLTIFSFEYACARIGLSAAEKGFADLFERCDVVMPSVIVFLDLSHQERLERMTNRNDIVLPFLKDQSFNDANKEFFVRLGAVIPIEFLDTTAMPEHIVQDKCAEVVMVSKGKSQLDRKLVRDQLRLIFNE